MVKKLVISGLWITLLEFGRNEILFKSYWVNHYQALGLKFETTPINGVLWIVWSFVFAYIIYEMQTKFSVIKMFWLSWLTAFVMMWITLFNLQVLPVTLLCFAVPMSMLEVSGAIFIDRALK